MCNCVFFVRAISCVTLSQFVRATVARLRSCAHGIPYVSLCARVQLASSEVLLAAQEQGPSPCFVTIVSTLLLQHNAAATAALTGAGV